LRTPSESKSVHYILTFISIVGYRLEVDEVRANQRVVDLVVVAQLNFYPLAERREHLGEHDLLVPHGSVAILFNARLALRKKRTHN